MTWWCQQPEKKNSNPSPTTNQRKRKSRRNKVVIGAFSFEMKSICSSIEEWNVFTSVLVSSAWCWYECASIRYIVQIDHLKCIILCFIPFPNALSLKITSNTGRFFRLNICILYLFAPQLKFAITTNRNLINFWIIIYCLWLIVQCSNVISLFIVKTPRWEESLEQKKKKKN